MTLRQSVHILTVATRGKGLTDVTGSIENWVAGQAIGTGLLTVFCRHTSASLVVQENTDPDVRADLESFLARLVPEAARYRHDAEGPDDMPAHIRAMLTQVQISVPVAGGRPLLGTWQAIYLYEHRDAPHRRELALHLVGEPPNPSPR